jgi:hypothetical protein
MEVRFFEGRRRQAANPPRIVPSAASEFMQSSAQSIKPKIGGQTASVKKVAFAAADRRAGSVIM